MKKLFIILGLLLLVVGMFSACEDIIDPGTSDTHIIIGFDSQGGSQPTPLAKTNEKNTEYGILPAVIREGYDFNGWWTGINGTGIKITPESIITNTTNHLLFANWTALEVTNIAFNNMGSQLTLNLKDIFNASVTIYPLNSLDKTISWTSVNPAIATVDENGCIKPVSGGTTRIRVTASNGVYAECLVIVKLFGIVAVCNRTVWYGTEKLLDPVSRIVVFQWSSHTSSAGNRNWKTVAASRDGVRLIAADDRGYVYTSHDRGYAWHRRPVGKRDWIDVASSHNGMRLIAADGDDGGGGNGEIFTSANGGISWERRRSAGKRDWKRVVSSADGMILAAIDGGDGGANGGNVFLSKDGGVTWSACPAGSRNWTALAISGDGRVMIAADTNVKDRIYARDKGNVFVSWNGGQSWTGQSVIGNRDWNSVAVSDNGSKLYASDGTQGRDVPWLHENTIGAIGAESSSGSDFFSFNSVWERKPASAGAKYNRITTLGNNIYAYIRNGEIDLIRDSFPLQVIPRPVSGKDISRFWLFGDQ